MPGVRRNNDVRWRVEGGRSLDMKKLTLRLSVAVITFVVGIACVLLWFLGQGAQESDAILVEAPATPQPELIDVSLCQLVAHPGEYAGRQVRVRAMYVLRDNVSALSDGSCAGAEAITYVVSIPPVFDEIDRIRQKAYGGRKDSLKSVEIVAVGTLQRLPRGSLADAPWNDKTRFEFRLERVEEAARP
jgi:hypothetical protein